MTAPLPPAIKACLAIERALDPLSDEDRADAIALCFPRTTTVEARMRMALEAIRLLAAEYGSVSWPSRLIRNLVDKALS